MSYATAEHDRMIAAMIKPCVVEAVDLIEGMVRVRSGTWVSAWVRWHSQAAGKARHWRVPSLKEQGILLSPSGVAGAGTFIPGLYGDAGPQPDNRDHVEVWRFDDGGSLVYDWTANSYTINLPAGTVTIKVGGSVVEVTAGQVQVSAGQIALVGPVSIDGDVTVNGALTTTGDITSAGAVIDAAGNTPNHVH